MEKGLKIFYDVDTQHDFMDKDGALYVPGAEEIKPNLKKLTEYARIRSIPILGSVDRHFGTEEYKHREGELKRWGGPFPDHCMHMSKWMEKIPETKYEMTIEEGFGAPPYKEDSGIYIPNRLDGNIDLGMLASGIQEVIGHGYISLISKCGLYFEKQNYDVFNNPAFKKFLDFTEVKEAVVYGVATDYCVKAAVLGMQQRGVQCYVVKDAIAAVSPDTGEKSLEEMVKSGAKLITTKGVLENKMEW